MRNSAATRSGNLELLQWLLMECRPKDTNWVRRLTLWHEISLNLSRLNQQLVPAGGVIAICSQAGMFVDVYIIVFCSYVHLHLRLYCFQKMVYYMICWWFSTFVLLCMLAFSLFFFPFFFIFFLQRGLIARTYSSGYCHLLTCTNWSVRQKRLF